MSSRGQAMVEAALVLPVMLALVLGGVLVARLADARAGLEGATTAAASAAARAPSAVAGQAAGTAAFESAISAYGLREATVTLDTGRFARPGRVMATGRADVDLGFAPVPGLPRAARLTASATAPVQTWRTR